MRFTLFRSGNSELSSILIRLKAIRRASVISILQERISFFRYLTDSDGAFSFRKYIQDESDRRNLFSHEHSQYEAIFKPLMTFVIDIMTREVLSLSDSFNRRITFVVDEFGSLSKMPAFLTFSPWADQRVDFWSWQTRIWDPFRIFMAMIAKKHFLTISTCILFSA